MDLILFPVVLLVYCSLSGNKRLSSTYREIKTISLPEKLDFKDLISISVAKMLYDS